MASLQIEGEEALTQGTANLRAQVIYLSSLYLGDLFIVARSPLSLVRLRIELGTKCEGQMFNPV